MTLAVDLYGIRIGHIAGDNPLTFGFTETDDAVRQFGIGSRVLSMAVPLATRPRRSDAARRRNFFAELLPEGQIRAAMFAAAGIRRSDDVVAFLRRYGRDVAGALQIWDLDDPTEPKPGSAVPVDDQRVRDLLEGYLQTPLANVPEMGRTSLGGIQPKIVLAREAGTWLQAVDGYPSTHILKPAIAQGLAPQSMIFDEEYGTRVTQSAGIAAVSANVERFDGLAALVVERYDRNTSYTQGRVHQEDANQMLGASGNQKYQELGGRVSLRRIADSLESGGAAAELKALAEQVILACAIGNLDLHAKNVSVLHLLDGSVRLAPAYDIVPMTHLPKLDGRLALAVGGVYAHAELRQADIVKELHAWRLRDAQNLVSDTLGNLHDAMRSELPLPDASPGVRENMLRITQNLIAGKSAGEGR